MKVIIFLFGLVAAAMADELSAEGLLSTSNNRFTARMFTEVIKQHPGKSVVQSAFSVLTPLSLLSLASVGESHDELLKALSFPNDNTTKEVFSLVNKKYRSVKGVDLRMANKVYVAQGYELNSEFAATSKSVFDSEVQNIDFEQSASAAKDINTWVEDHTNHRIKDLVDPNSLNSDTRAVLVNAIYFKGSWKEKFDKRYTKDMDFHVSNDKTVKLPFMYKETDFLYGTSEELDAALLEMPYEGGEASFLVVLPNKVDGLPALEEKLKDPSLLEKAVKSMYSQTVTVHLPKFKIETETNLKEALQNMDVKKLFGLEARLDNLLKKTGGLYVSEAKQKAFIEVNEEGAEAAAANEFVVMTESFVIQPTFMADRPFYFELRHDQVLFNGVFIKPKST